MSNFKVGDRVKWSVGAGAELKGTLQVQKGTPNVVYWSAKADNGVTWELLLESQLTKLPEEIDDYGVNDERCNPYSQHPSIKPLGPETTIALPGTKYDGGKSRVDLIPARELLQIGDVLAFGATRYAPDNWKQVPDGKARYLAATLRHLYKHMSGELLDTEPYPDGRPGSGLSHLAHAATSLLFLMHFQNEEENVK